MANDADAWCCPVRRSAVEVKQRNGDALYPYLVTMPWWLTRQATRAIAWNANGPCCLCHPWTATGLPSQVICRSNRLARVGIAAQLRHRRGPEADTCSHLEAEGRSVGRHVPGCLEIDRPRAECPCHCQGGSETFKGCHEHVALDAEEKRRAQASRWCRGQCDGGAAGT